MDGFLLSLVHQYGSYIAWVLYLLPYNMKMFKTNLSELWTLMSKLLFTIEGFQSKKVVKHFYSKNHIIVS